jgi:hypothetical protein
MLLVFAVILIGAYSFLVVPTGRNGRRETATGRDAKGGTPGEP